MEINKWDEHLYSDIVRNKFIIPYITKLLERRNDIKSVLDVGSGSGYIGNKIVSKFRNLYYLNVEKSLRNVLYSKEKYKDNKDRLFYEKADFSRFRSKQRFDLILVIFTLVDFKLNSKFIKNLYTHLSSKGILIITLPDSLIDVKKTRDFEMLQHYIEGFVSIKNKNITKNYKVPFVANRFEMLVELLLKAGLLLVNLKRIEYNDKKAFFILELSCSKDA